MLVNMVLAYKGVVIFDPNTPVSFWRHSCFMIVSFILFGSFPLASFFAFCNDDDETQGFVMSCVFTTLGMAVLGVIKARAGERVSTQVNHTFKIG